MLLLRKIKKFVYLCVVRCVSVSCAYCFLIHSITNLIQFYARPTHRSFNRTHWRPLVRLFALLITSFIVYCYSFCCLISFLSLPCTRPFSIRILFLQCCKTRKECKTNNLNSFFFFFCCILCTFFLFFFLLCLLIVVVVAIWVV